MPARPLDVQPLAPQAHHMPVQDDSREQQMVALFNLTVARDRGRRP